SIIYYLYGKFNKLEKLWFWPSLVLGLTCLFMTISRSSILVFFLMASICFGFYIVLSLKNKDKKNISRTKKLLIGYCLLVGISGIVLYKHFDFYYAIKDIMELYFDTRTGVSNARLFALAPTMSVLLKNPFFVLFGYTKSSYFASDNTFADILMLNGVIGFILY